MIARFMLAFALTLPVATTLAQSGAPTSAQLAWLAVILALMLTLTPFAAALALRVGLE